MQKKAEAFIMNLFCMEGSWDWAKKKMLDGCIVRSTEWVGHLKLRANPKTDVLEINFTKEPGEWLSAATVLSMGNLYSDITTYEVFMWPVKEPCIIDVLFDKKVWSN